jgi:dihydropteroate synthase
MFSWQRLCGDAPAVMGIVNVTPDSFSDGGRFLDPDAAIAHGLALVADGVALVDVGGESTRPGAAPVDEAEELRRVVPVVAGLATAGCAVSVDTTKPAVAAAAIEAGAVVVNDVRGGRDADLLQVVAEAGAGMVLMHMQGEPRTMQDDPRYDDVVTAVGDFLAARLDVARAAGVADDALCVDPGIGFGKLARHNLALLARLDELVARLGVPVMVGTSRKTFLGAIVAGEDGSIPPPETRDDATLATACWAVDLGARVVRVHDARPVAEMVRMMTLMASLDARAVA